MGWGRGRQSPYAGAGRAVVARGRHSALSPAPSQEEFKGPFVKLNPQITDADYDALWEEIDGNGDKSLSFEELATYFGFNLNTLKGEEMSDEKIMELFSVRALNAAPPAAMECANGVGRRAPLAAAPVGARENPSLAVRRARDSQAERPPPPCPRSCKRICWR